MCDVEKQEVGRTIWENCRWQDFDLSKIAIRDRSVILERSEALDLSNLRTDERKSEWRWR